MMHRVCNAKATREDDTAGYVASFEVESGTTVNSLAARHQREEDCH